MAHPPTRRLGGKEIHHIGLADVRLGGLCVSRHMASSFSLTFFFGMALNVVLRRKWWRVWPGPWAEATVRCRGFGSVVSKDVSETEK